MRNGFPEWWKHGQKVCTRKDGILTLNIAPDAEYWLTNDEGKEVYVFSADILGPVKNDAEVCRPMSNIDKRALREAAEKALPAMKRLLMMPNDELFDEALLNVDGDVDAANAFNLLTGPETVLALLDELEAKDKLNAELMEKQRLIDICQGQGLEHRIAAEKRAETAEKRIAELEAREVKLPELKMLSDYLAEVTMREREDILVGVRLEFFRALEEAGVKVSAAAGKGE